MDEHDDPESLDDLLDMLPGHLRRKVAGHLNGTDTGTALSHEASLAAARERLQALRDAVPEVPYVDTFVDPEPHLEWARSVLLKGLDLDA